MADSLPYVMTPTEILCGYVFGSAGTLGPAMDATATPRQALERVVRTALLRPPCGVAFSGGRDSSAVLAVATHVARRDGLAEPVPITRVFPADADAEEGQWQERVIRHLGLGDWQRVTIGDELDVIGPLAREHLLDHGVLWPPTIAADGPVVAEVGGGSLIDGEGGDEVFGDALHRIAPLARVLRRPRPLRWRRLRSGLGVLAPRRMRAGREQRQWDAQTTPWLRPAGRDVLLTALERVSRDRPLSFAAALRRAPCERVYVLAAANRRYLAGRSGVDVSSPLVHPEVVQALARHGGVLGPGTRTDVLRSVIGDLLPDDVLARTSKATFTNSYLGRHTREFAAMWDGTGVDPDLVDADALRRSWLDAPHALTAALLQQAWLAVGRRPGDSAGFPAQGVVDRPPG